VEASKPGAVAFFDMDGTLVRGQTLVLLVKFMRLVPHVNEKTRVAAGLMSRRKEKSTWLISFRKSWPRAVT
jgi:phosphoserine phosphatase